MPAVEKAATPQYSASLNECSVAASVPRSARYRAVEKSSQSVISRYTILVKGVCRIMSLMKRLSRVCERGACIIYYPSAEKTGLV